MKEYGTTVFCEDIRDEVGDKKSYLGVYTGDLVAEAFPALFPTFAFATTVLEPHVECVGLAKYVVSFEKYDGTLLTIVEIDLPEDRHQSNIGPPDPTAEYNGMLCAFKMSPLIIEGEGYLRVRIHKGDRVIKVGSLRVIKRLSEVDGGDNI